jgi:hypothetical protein
MALARLRRRTPTTALLDDDRSCGRSGKVGLVGGMSSVVSSNALVDVDAVRSHVGVDAGGKVCRVRSSETATQDTLRGEHGHLSLGGRFEDRRAR